MAKPFGCRRLIQPEAADDVVATLADIAIGAPLNNTVELAGYLDEERRHYSLSRHGQELVAMLDAARREGIQAHVDQLDREEQQRLRKALAPGERLAAYRRIHLGINLLPAFRPPTGPGSSSSA